MCKLSPTEKAIIANIKNKDRQALALALGMKIGTLNSHIARIKRKRDDAKNLLTQTNFVKKELYPRRTGE